MKKTRSFSEPSRTTLSPWTFVLGNIPSNLPLKQVHRDDRMLHYLQSPVYKVAWNSHDKWPDKFFSSYIHRWCLIFILDIAFWQILPLFRSWTQFLGLFVFLRRKMKTPKFKKNLSHRKQIYYRKFVLKQSCLFVWPKFEVDLWLKRQYGKTIFLHPFWLLVSSTFKVRRFSLESVKTGTLMEE